MRTLRLATLKWQPRKNHGVLLRLCENLFLKSLHNMGDNCVNVKIASHEQPVVLPQVWHFMQVPFRIRVKKPQVEQGSPS